MPQHQQSFNTSAAGKRVKETVTGPAAQDLAAGVASLSGKVMVTGVIPGADTTAAPSLVRISFSSDRGSERMPP